MSNRYLSSALAFIVIAIFASLLYIPFLNNSWVFDDHGLFSSLVVYDYAQTPFSLRPRTFPYFTLGFVQVVIGSVEAHRIISLILHILCAWMLFRLLSALLYQSLQAPHTDTNNEPQRRTQAVTLALIGAIWFAIHPVTVYGAGYLVQRTILFATLFSLLSLWFYHRAFAENRTTDVVTAALFYSAAVFSKEHAVMLPLAAIALTTLFNGNVYLHAKRAGLFLVLCIPAAITVVIASRYLVATSYEPYVSVLFSQIQGIPLLEKPWGQWLVSMILQSGFFFDYLGYWLIPDIRSMSIDMKINFTQVWTAWWMVPRAILFLGCPIIATYLLRRGRPAALFGCGLLYCWLLFLTELAAVRFQEPFVLYRAYLWAPGYVLMTMAVFSAFPLRLITFASIPVFAACIWLAQERLTSLTNEATVWTDAASKLESKSIVGAGRILHMRGRDHMKEKKFTEAISDFTDAIPHYPTAGENYYQRGLALYSLQRFSEAQKDFDHALTLSGRHGPVQFARGQVFERYGCVSEAVAAYSASLALGVQIAKIKIDELAPKNSLRDEKVCLL